MSLSACGRRYGTRETAARSKLAGKPGAVVTECRCGSWHIRFPGRNAAAGSQQSRVTKHSQRFDDEWYAQSAAKRFVKFLAEGVPPVARPELGPCLLYIGASNGRGYGQFSYNRKNGYAHRYAWEVENGPIPDGLTVDHLCRVRNCVRVSHMELVDGVTNYLRAVAVRTHCPNGHEYGPDNEAKYTGSKCRRCEEVTVARAQAKQVRVANGLPNRRIKYDQAKVHDAIAAIRSGRAQVSSAAREVGCNPNYLGRRTWEETRLSVLSRDGHLCVSCGRPATDVQHRIARLMGGTRNPLISFGMANLISMCRECHDRAESRDEHMHGAGYYLESWQDRYAEAVLICGQDGGIAVWLDDSGNYLGEDGSALTAPERGAA